MSGNKYIKSGIWYIIGNLLIKGISFFTLPIFTRLLGTADFGKFNLFMSYENILNVIIGLGIAGTIKTAYLDYGKKFKNYFSSVIFLTFLFSIIVDVFINIIVLLFGQSINGFWGCATCNLLVVCSLATAIYNLLSMKYVIDLQYRKNLAMSFGYTLGSVFLSIVLCLTVFSGQRFLARIIGNTIPLVLITFSLSFICLLKCREFYNPSYWKYALKLGIPLIFHSLSLVIMQQADKIMVNSFCGDEATGIYGLACNISIILTIVQSSVDNSWSPWFYRNLKERKYENIINGNNGIIALFLYLSCGFILISPELVRLTSPIEYSEAIYALIPLNISVYATFMYMFAVNKEYFFKKTKTIAFATIATTILDIVLNYLMIPKFGFISASYTTLIAKIVLFVIHWIVSNRIDPNRVVKMRTLLASFVFVFIVSIISMVFMNQAYVRFPVIVLITVFAFYYLKKKEVYKMIKNK